MATIVPDNQATNNQLNAGAGNAATQPPAGIGVPPVVQPANVNYRPNVSNLYSDFSKFQKANVKSGQRLTDLLSSNIQQKGAAVGHTLQTAAPVAQGIENEKERISRDLSKIGGAVKSAETGDYSQFQTMLSPTDTTNVQSNLMQLAKGETQAGQLGQQAGNIFAESNIQNQALQGLTGQSLTEAGRRDILQNLLGRPKQYSTSGAGVLDQALIAANNQRLNQFLGTLGTTAAQTQAANIGTQRAIGGGLSDVISQAQAAKTELLGQEGKGGLLQKGLGTLETQLTEEAKKAQEKRQQEQLDILNQFKTQQFKQDVAGQLGIGEGTVLFNQLNTPEQDYGITDAAKLAEYKDNPYLSLAKDEIKKANVIGKEQLAGYDVMSRLLGQTPEAYTQVGTVDPSYALNAKQFQEDLAKRYEQAAAEAERDVVMGSNTQSYQHGLGGWTTDYVTRSVGGNVSQFIDPETIRQAAKQFTALSAPQTATPTITRGRESDIIGAAANRPYDLGKIAEGAAIGGVKGGVPGAVIGALTRTPIIAQVGKGINDFVDSIIRSGEGGAISDAQRWAAADFQNKWQNYLKNKGYTNVARIAPSDLEKFPIVT